MAQSGQKESKTTLYVLILVGIIAIGSIIISYQNTRGISQINNDIEKMTQITLNLSNQIDSIQQSLNEYKLMSQQISSLNQSLSQQIQSLNNMIAQMNYPIQVYDALNRTVVITQQPTRIVSLAPSTTEMLFDIGAGNLVVGVDDNSNYPPIVNELVINGTIQRVGGFDSISLEKVISLKPDLVVGSTGVQFKYIYQLSQYGVTALSLNDESISDILTDILLLGKITGHYQQALNLTNNLKNEIISIYSKVSGSQNKPTVLFIVWVNPYYAAGGSSFWNDLISLSGGLNSLENVSQAWPAISWEDVVKLNPQVIIATEYAGGFSNATQLINWLESQPGGANISAVETGRVYMLHGNLSDIASRPSPRIVEMQEVLAAILHPEDFGNIQLPNDLNDTILAQISQYVQSFS
ncbi:helical backbone metal receptor [Fervidicoccus sp.]|uniref:ABC transporter substrate-binding protein n=1 Tax=Fervidicoccus sp. TaxID=2060324 RepID=UPI003CBE2232